ncbi:MAG TPA: methyl-accepting chemotaxis protein [Glaciecola sp.]|nr:methyl-accepting chemotaxis protein [Glaciecola sp.]
MQLTVSQRLISGFSLLGVLIIVISLSSLVYINNIQHATAKVHEQTLPVLSLSKDLQAQFLLMSKLMFQAYLHQDVNEITMTKKKFSEHKTDFDNTFAQLKVLTQSDPDLHGQLRVIGVSYNQYITYTVTMFSAHTKEVQSLQQPLRLGAVIGGISETSTLITNDTAPNILPFSITTASKSQLAFAASEQKMGLAIREIDALIESMNTHDRAAKTYLSETGNLATWQIVFIAIAALVTAIVIAISTLRSIVQPLRKTNNMLSIIASGDLSQQLDDTSHNEFGQLAKNVNALVSNLKQMIIGIADRAELLSAAAEQTTSVTNQTTLSIGEQKSQITVISDATIKMQIRAAGVKQNAEKTLAQITLADTEATKIKHLSIENKRTMENLATDVDAAAQVINKLHQDSASIGRILDVIRGVADQTNLLALNAAIEASRAGEQGRGFAVVADEVRTLANRTQQSTQEINSMIEMLQEGAKRAVEVMHQGKAQTDICVAQTIRATEAINSITDAVHKAHAVSFQIEESARYNLETTHDISLKLESIVGIAQETSVGAIQTSESTKSVADLAEQLQQSIQHFKV